MSTGKKTPQQSKTTIVHTPALLQVEEIARFALDSFPVSQPVELKQYLEQFLGQSKVSKIVLLREPIRPLSLLSDRFNACLLKTLVNRGSTLSAIYHVVG